MKDEERSALQSRIKHQRRELRRLNRDIQVQNMVADRHRRAAEMARTFAFDRAARLAESFLFGKRIARYIRDRA